MRRLLRHGKTKIEKELDIVDIVQNLRYVKMMAYLSLSKYQRAFLPYLSENLVSFSSFKDVNRKSLTTLLTKGVKK
jgi:hypothetical protein